MKSMIYIGVFVIYFGFIIITSLMSAKKVETMSDFTTGGNKMGLLLGVGTSMATWLSVASVMGVPGNIYSRGVCAVFGWVAGWFLATGLMPLVAVFIPLIVIGMGGKMIMPSLPEGITSDYMFPRLIMDHINPILGALALTAICAAAVSTANSMLLHCSTSLIYDIKRVIQGKAASAEEDAKTTKQLRITILSLGVIAVICAIGQFSLLADGFTYVYGAFGSMFFASIWLGLYIKRMNNLAAFASMIVGLIAYAYCMLAGAPFGLPAFIVSCGLSLVAAVICILIGKKPPVEAYESYFTDNVSAKTLELAHKIRKDVM